MQALGDRRRVILLVLVIVVIVCLLGVLAYRVMVGTGDEVATQPPTATPVPTEEAAPSEEPAGEVESTPIPTPVISTQPTEEPTEEPTQEPTVEPTDEPTSEHDGDANGSAATVRDPNASEFTVPSSVTMVEVVKIDELLQNGDFEEGFAADGVALEWEGFRTTGASINFSAETAEPFVNSGDTAQRVSVEFAREPDQIGGLLQTVEVVPGQPYTLTLHGQIRSGFGSVEASSYGYRIEYAVDYKGGDSWQSISPDAWVELPWPEQALDTADVSYSEYAAQIRPSGEKMTLFVRTWNKWPNGSLSEYSFDDFSLVGPVPGSVEVMAKTELEADDAAAFVVISEKTVVSEEIINNGLPVTGYGDENSLVTDARFWGAVIVLLMLAGGAVYRSKWGW